MATPRKILCIPKSKDPDDNIYSNFMLEEDEKPSPIHFNQYVSRQQFLYGVIPPNGRALPEFIGQNYIDTEAEELYVATDLNCNSWLNITASRNIINWNNIINKPNTIDGYGIIDAYNKTEIDRYLVALDIKIQGKANLEHEHKTLTEGEITNILNIFE